MRFRVRRSSIRSGALRPLLLGLWAMLGLFWLAGCQKRDDVKSYTVKKLPSAARKTAAPPPESVADQGPPDRDRMLAAIVPHDKVGWFFKVTGPREAVARKMEEFLSLVQSVKFPDGDDAKPEWTLPDGWTSEKGNSIRFATLRTESDGETLETTVIPLPAVEIDPHSIEYVLSNVNRWCGQMGLPEKTKESLFAEEQPKNAEVQQLDVAGTKATLVNLVGRLKSDGMSNAPFASGQRPGGGKAAPSKQRESVSTTSGRPKWKVPDGWTESEGNQFSLAAFAVAAGDKSVKTTVSRAGGDLLANVNRWRQQLGLEEWSPEDMSKSAKQLSIDGSEGTLVELVGKDARSGQPSCTLGVIVPRGESSWFFKLTGDVTLAQREKANFEAFVQSVKFE